MAALSISVPFYLNNGSLRECSFTFHSELFHLEDTRDKIFWFCKLPGFICKLSGHLCNLTQIVEVFWFV